MNGMKNGALFFNFLRGEIPEKERLPTAWVKLRLTVHFVQSWEGLLNGSPLEREANLWQLKFA